MALSTYSLFKVNIENLVQSKVVICKNFNIQPSELERMAYWEYEMTVKECEKIAEEEKKRQEEQQDGQPGAKGYQSQANRMMRSYQSQMPRIPNPTMPKMPRI